MAVSNGAAFFAWLILPNIAVPFTSRGRMRVVARKGVTSDQAIFLGSMVKEYNFEVKSSLGKIYPRTVLA
jgi:hypothetical protein